MRLIIRTIAWKNFLSTGNEPIRFDFSSSRRVLFTGVNGSGKSTIADALMFGLFGRPYRDINKPQLINSITNSNCYVEVEFTIGGHEYKICRGMKPAIFEIYKDGELLNQDSHARDYQKFLETSILHTNHKIMSQLVVLGRASYVPFMELPAGQRRLLIEDLLDLRILGIMSTLLRGRLSQLQDERTNLTNDLRLLHDRRATHERLYQEQTRDLKTDLEQIQQLEQESRELEAKLLDDSELTARLRALRERHLRYKDAYGKLDGAMQLRQATLNFIQQHDHCETCQQAITDKHRQAIAERYAHELQSLQNDRLKLDELYAKLSADIANCERVLEMNRKMRVQYEAVRARIASLQTMLERANIDKLQSELDVIRAQEHWLQQKLTNLDDTIALHNSAAALLADDGLKAYIISQILPQFNRLVNDYLERFNLLVSIEFDEQFQERILSRYRDNFSYASFSEGEKQRIDLAILFAWRDLLASRSAFTTNLLILDEIFDSSLDATSIDSLRTILEEQAELFQTNVVVISHRDAMNDYFTDVYRFQKVHNFSVCQEL